MKSKFLSIVSLLLLVSCSHAKQEAEKKQMAADSAAQASTKGSVINYFNIPGPIKFDGSDFYFSWSSKPAANYYKQEYLQSGESAEQFNEMLMLELAFRNLPLRDIAEAKAREIQDRMKTDPIAKFELGDNQKENEILLDFMLSADYGTDKAISEWNIYRYRTYTGSQGEPGIMVFALSKHAYGMEGEKFVNDIKANRQKYIRSFVSLDFPNIQLTK